jgi:hypothetical protein
VNAESQPFLCGSFSFAPISTPIRRTRSRCCARLNRQQRTDTDQPEVAREVIAGRIIAAARLGERDPARLLEAALRKPD